jgi:hypothetical protein
MYYAWTEIRGADSDGNATSIKAGTEVTPASLNVSEEEFAELVAARSVRTTSYPDMPETFQGSPKDFILEKKRKELEELEDSFDTDPVYEPESETDGNDDDSNVVPSDDDEVDE